MPIPFSTISITILNYPYLLSSDGSDNSQWDQDRWSKMRWLERRLISVRLYIVWPSPDRVRSSRWTSLPNQKKKLIISFLHFSLTRSWFNRPQTCHQFPDLYRKTLGTYPILFTTVRHIAAYSNCTHINRIYD